MTTTYRFWLCKFGENFDSDAFTNQLDCMDAFVKALRADDVFWGQFIRTTVAEDGAKAEEVVCALEGCFR